MVVVSIDNVTIDDGNTPALEYRPCEVTERL